jgi:protein ImuB
MFACIHVPDFADGASLLDCAYCFSPRVEATSPGTIIIDLSGTERLFGNYKIIAQRIHTQVQQCGFESDVSIASNPDAAHYAAKGFAGITIIPAGQEAQRLGPLPVDVLELEPDIQDILDSWGITDFKSLAALPPIPLTERLGQRGLHLQRLAQGAFIRELVPAEPPASFEECEELEEAVELLEPLTFILNRLLEQLMHRLVQRALATDHIEVDLTLELHADVDLRAATVSTIGVTQYQRTVKLPVPTQDAKALLKLVQLDLAAHPPHAPVKKIRIEAIPARARLTQMGLFQPLAPEPAKLEITLARLRAVVGEQDAEERGHVGFPMITDTHRPDSFRVLPFNPKRKDAPGITSTRLALRVFRPPVLARVEVNADVPVWISFDGRRGKIVHALGPWRGAGEWWDAAGAWLHDEWDIRMDVDGQTALYRIYRDITNQQWFVQGLYD